MARLRKAATRNKPAPALSQNLNKCFIVKVFAKRAYQLGLLHVRVRMAEPVSETEGAVGAHWGRQRVPPKGGTLFFKQSGQPNIARCGFNFHRFAAVTPLINLPDLTRIFQELFATLQHARAALITLDCAQASYQPAPAAL